MIWSIVLATLLLLCVGCAARLAWKLKKTKRQLEAAEEKLAVSEHDLLEASVKIGDRENEIVGLRNELEIEKKIPKMRPYERVVIEQRGVKPVELRARLIVPEIMPDIVAEDQLLIALKDEIKKFWTVKRRYSTWDSEISASLWVVPNMEV